MVRKAGRAVALPALPESPPPHVRSGGVLDCQVTYAEGRISTLGSGT